MREAPRLAQATVARLRYPLDDPRMGELVTSVDHINRLADHAPGFVWRWQAPGGHLPVTEDDPRTLVNISVWTGYLPLHDFTYRGPHGHLVRRRRVWIELTQQPSTVLWWVDRSARPTPQQAAQRLAYLRRYGPTVRAFTVRTRFTAEGRPDDPRRNTPGVRDADDTGTS